MTKFYRIWSPLEGGFVCSNNSEIWDNPESALKTLNHMWRYKYKINKPYHQLLCYEKQSGNTVIDLCNICKKIYILADDYCCRTCKNNKTNETLD